MKTWKSLGALGLAPILMACASASPTRDLGLRHIVLYQNGVAYFERTGALTGDRIRLKFKEKDVDDVLKTLVVVEQGGRVAGRKPSTVTALLPEKSSAVGDGTTWIDVVLSPRPTRELSIAYAVPSAAWKSAYRVVLPDNRGGKSALLQAWAVVDNVTEEDWSDVALTLATGAPLTFTTHLRDPRFVERPDAPASPDATATAPIYASRGTPGDRDGDGIPDSEDKCPDEPGSPQTDGCPQFVRRIQGSSEILILQHITFGQDSDAMLATSRAVVDQTAEVLKTHPDITRVVIEGFASRDEKDGFSLSARRAGAVKAALVSRGVKTELATRGFADTRPIAAEDKASEREKNRRVEFRIDRAKNDAPSGGRVTIEGASGSARGIATGREAAGSFRYDLANRITIPRRSSSMVTIVNDEVPGEDILLYRPEAAVPGSDAAPFRAARLRNKTSAGFLSGPVAIFAGGTFVGEGLLDRLNPGDTALIPYGLDATTTVKVERANDETPLRVIGLVKGMLTVEDKLTTTTRYLASVGSAAPARLFVRHAVREGYKLTGAPPESEPSGDAFLVPIPITPGQKSELAMEENIALRREVSLLTIEGVKLAAYLKGSDLPAPLATRLAEVASLRAELSKRDVEADGLRERLGELAERAGELRESLRAVERTPRAAGLQKELVDRLTDATKRTDELSGQLAAASASRAQARSKLVDAVRDLHLDASSPGT